MKLWKENKVDKEWELSNKEIAEQFLKSKYANSGGGSQNLVNFITASDGLNSIWEWNEMKGSIEGSNDILEILTIIRNLRGIK